MMRNMTARCCHELVAPIPHSTLTEWTDSRPAISRALWLPSLVDAAISREWIVNVGRRTAYPYHDGAA